MSAFVLSRIGGRVGGVGKNSIGMLRFAKKYIYLHCLSVFASEEILAIG